MCLSAKRGQCLGEGELDTFLVDFVAQLDESGAAVDGRPGNVQRVPPGTDGGVDNHVETAQAVVPVGGAQWTASRSRASGAGTDRRRRRVRRDAAGRARRVRPRSEEHTSELQSLTNLVCRLLLEKKKKKR